MQVVILNDTKSQKKFAQQFLKDTETEDLEESYENKFMEKERPAVDPEWKTIYQWLNLIAYLLCIGANYSSQAVMPITLNQIAMKYDVRIDPAVWAFGIWAVIYSSIAIYAIG